MILKCFFQQSKKVEIRKGPMTKEEWDRLEKSKTKTVFPDIDSKKLHYDENLKKEKAEYSWVLSGSPPPSHAPYKTFKKPQGF